MVKCLDMGIIKINAGQQYTQLRNWGKTKGIFKRALSNFWRHIPTIDFIYLLFLVFSLILVLEDTPSARPAFSETSRD